LNIILIGVIIYIIFQLILGIYISKFIKSEDDYLLGGRRLGYLLVIFSIFATWFGAESCIGTAGAAYESGLSGVTADPFGYGMVLIIMGLFFAIPLYKMKLTTIADFFRIRYSTSTEKIIAIIMIPTSILWAAAQIRAFGLILSATSEIQLHLAILISATIVIIYTTFGGLLADAWTDLIQGLILMVGLIVIAILVFFDGINIHETIQNIAKEKLVFTSNNDELLSYSTLKTIEAWAIPICGSLIAQELIQRIFSAKSHTVAWRSSIIAGSLYIFLGLIPLSIGLIGLQLIPDLEYPEQILPLVAQKYLTPVLYVIFSGALISAILSTVDSTLLASSALFSHNVIFNMVNLKSEKMKLKISRLNVLIAGIIAYLLATYAEGVYELVKDASAFGSAGIFIVFIFGMYTKLGNGLTANITLLVGSTVWIIAHYFLKSDLSYIIALTSSFLTFVITTLSEKFSFSLLPQLRKYINKN